MAHVGQCVLAGGHGSMRLEKYIGFRDVFGIELIDICRVYKYALKCGDHLPVEKLS